MFDANKKRSFCFPSFSINLCLYFWSYCMQLVIWFERKKTEKIQTVYVRRIQNAKNNKYFFGNTMQRPKKWKKRLLHKWCASKSRWFWASCMMIRYALNETKNKSISVNLCSFCFCIVLLPVCAQVFFFCSSFLFSDDFFPVSNKVNDKSNWHTSNSDFSLSAITLLVNKQIYTAYLQYRNRKV